MNTRIADAHVFGVIPKGSGEVVADTLGRQSPEVRQTLLDVKDDPTAFARRYLPEGSSDSIYTNHDTAELPTATPPQRT